MEKSNTIYDVKCKDCNVMIRNRSSRSRLCEDCRLKRKVKSKREQNVRYRQKKCILSKIIKESSDEEELLSNIVN